MNNGKLDFLIVGNQNNIIRINKLWRCVCMGFRRQHLLGDFQACT